MGPEEKRILFRRARAWLHGLSTSPHALGAMMALSFLDACVSPILPEVVLVPLLLGDPRKRWRFAALASIASVVGGLFGYFLGYALWEGGVDEFFYANVPGFTREGFEDVSRHFGHSAFWVVFLAGLTPLPYKLFTIASGVFHDHVDLVTFVVASVLSRSLRFALEVWLVTRFGEPVLKFVVRRFGLILLLVSLALLGLVAWCEYRT